MNLKQHVTKQHVITVYNMPKHYRCDRVTYVLLAYRYIMSRYAVKSSTNFPKLSDYNTHHQVEHSKILHCAHNAFMYFVRYHNQQRLLPYTILEELFCITEVERVYSAVRNKSLYKTYTSWSLNG